MPGLAPVDVTTESFALMAIGAFTIGFSKTSISGLSAIAIAIFASVMPTKESTAAILLLLITGDVVAAWRYRRQADWQMLRRLVPGILPGLALGTWFLTFVSDTVLRRGIGVMLIVLAAVQVIVRWRGTPERQASGVSHLAAGTAGVATGFATMTANAAGGVMTLYLVAQGVQKAQFLGTNSALFFGVNLTKVPFSAGIGLMGWTTLRLTAMLAPFVLVGTWVGLRFASGLAQHHFDRLVLGATVVAAISLVVR